MPPEEGKQQWDTNPGSLRMPDARVLPLRHEVWEMFQNVHNNNSHRNINKDDPM